MIKIPLKKIPSQRLKISLDGQKCEIKIYYRFGSTYLDLICNGSTVVLGAVCRNGAKINQSETPLFKGTLHFYDKRGQGAPFYEEYGERFVLLYLSQGEKVPPMLRF